jgi:hypothetical protein
MASCPLRLLKLAQEISIGGLLLGTSAILLVEMYLGANVAFWVGRGICDFGVEKNVGRARCFARHFRDGMTSFGSLQVSTTNKG